MLSVDNINFTEELPDELNLIIFQFFPISDLILDMSNVCQSWRRDYCFPLIMKYLRQVNNNNTIIIDGKDDENNIESGQVELKEFADLFKTRIGRSLLRRSLRERLFGLACKFIDGFMAHQVQHNYTFRGQVIGGDDGNWWKLYREEWELLIEQFKSYFTDLKEKFDKNKQLQEIIVTNTTTVDDKQSGVVSGVLNYLSSRFTRGGRSNKQIDSSCIKTTKPTKKTSARCKCVMVGESNVGKTSFMNCLTKQMPCSVVDDYRNTPTYFPASFYVQRYALVDGSLLALEIWEPPVISGSYAPLTTSYEGSKVAFCMFDLSGGGEQQQEENQSLKYLSQYFFNDERETGLKKECEMILIGNKNDHSQQFNGDHSSLTQTRMRAHSLSMNELNGALYVEMNNMEVKYAHYVSLYAAMMIYMINGGSINSENN